MELLFQLLFPKRSLLIISKSSIFLSKLAIFTSSHPSPKKKRSWEKKEWENLDHALRLLHLVSPPILTIGRPKNHPRLVQDCIQQLSQTRPSQELSLKRPQKSVLGGWDGTALQKNDALYLFDEMLGDGKRTDPAVTISGVLSEFGDMGDLDRGMQIHSLAGKGGFDGYVSVGSALISLYCKCGVLRNACKLFENMPMRNTVS